MTPGPAGSRLEFAGQLAFVVMCVAVTAAAVRYIMLDRGTGQTQPLPSPFEVGTHLPSADKLGPNGATPTLVVALSTACRFCVASMPFYQQLTRLDTVRSGHIDVAVVSMQDRDTMTRFLGQYDVVVSRVVPFTDTALPPMSTPALILIDANGVVLKVWQGQLKTADQANVVTALRAAAGHSVGQGH